MTQALSHRHRDVQGNLWKHLARQTLLRIVGAKSN
eukprot:CAMPEP_0194368776 /NCGR_PEP_ID=MMETSP0174-20130528/16980_1 /TAXON_ID=216777 /ORGANISM="Proboscia alata, Strain PI-D3" /LENGTH=34 /DNA_ID= /DNA_START= /DNA_END= /DNA_ORIENTATION=